MRDTDTPRRALARELAALRHNASLTTRALAGQLGIDQSRVSRIETGVAKVTADEARGWALACGANETDAREYASRASFALTETRAWRHLEPGGTVEAQQLVGRRERESRTLATFHHEAVFGLTQTADYARDVFTVAGIRDDEIEASVEARLARQGTLIERRRIIEAIHTEGALRWRPGAVATLVAQLDRLLELSTFPNVHIGVLPWNIQAPMPYEYAFTLYTERTGEETAPLLEVETVTGELTSIEPGIVADHQRWLDKLRSAALWSDNARSYIEGIRRDLAS